jgi:type I restriction enzyme, S subunit
MKSRPFEELFEIPLRNGLTKPKQVRGEGYKMVNMGELFAFPRIKNVPMDRVPLADKEKELSMLESGDLLFARQSLVREGAGECSIFIADESEVCFESHLIRCRLNKNIANPFFYYYFFRSKFGKQTIDAIIEQGAGASGIRGSDLAKLQVPYIAKETQDEIAFQLNLIDDKIELNRQINKTLEQIAQAMFKSWFVDFDPVKAKVAAKQTLTPNLSQSERERIVDRAAMRAISGLTDDQVDQLGDDQRQQLAATAALFPDELVDSELGEIPKGWEYGSLSSICSFSDERIDVAKLTLENYISTENMLEGKRGITAATSLPTVKSVPYFQPGHILISNIRPYFKKIWLSRFDGGRSADVLGIKAIDYDSIEFLYNLLYQDSFFNFMMASSKGAKMPRGDKDAIMGWTILLPSHEIRRVYSKFISGYYKIIESLIKENQYLIEIRDVLLPRLLSGELLATQPEQREEIPA